MSGKRSSFVCAEVWVTHSSTAKMAAGITRAKIFFVNKGIPPLVGQSRFESQADRTMAKEGSLQIRPVTEGGFKKSRWKSVGTETGTCVARNQRTSLPVS